MSSGAPRTVDLGEWSGRPADGWPDAVRVRPARRAIDATVRVPGSKSLTNRALLLAALSDGSSVLHGALVDAEDAQVMVAALRQLGAGVHVDEASATVRVDGVGGAWKLKPGQQVALDLRNAGTATRFLTAAALLAPAGASVLIDGDARMRERPIGELVDALRGLDVRGDDGARGDACTVIEYAARAGFPPVRIHGTARARSSAPNPAGAPVWRASFGATASSQFVSAVLLAGAFAGDGSDRGAEVRFTAPLTSEPYVEMTVRLLRRWGVGVRDDRPRVIEVRAAGVPKGHELSIEPDASGATYFMAAAALVPASRVTLDGLDCRPGQSLQGDAAFADVIERFGAVVRRDAGATVVEFAGPLRAVDVDLSGMPDTAMTAAVLAACVAAPGANAGGGGGGQGATSTLRGLRTLRVKETDRLAALVAELSKIGARVEIFSHVGHGGEPDEGLRITPLRRALRPAMTPSFETYRDHRMAMSLALLGLVGPERDATESRGTEGVGLEAADGEGVEVRDPACVAKTYAGFWAELARVVRRR